MMLNTDFTTLDATTMDTTTAYRLLVGAVVPRPVAWITTRSKAGVVNAAPFSSYNYVAHSPPMLAVNIGSREGELKDTARNMLETGEFVVNVATVDTMDLMHASSAEFPAHVSEVDALGIDLLPGQRVAVPRVARSPIQMECRLERSIPLGRGLNTLYIGEILAFHIASSVMDGRYIDSVKLRPIARLGGPLYAELGTLHTRAQLQKPPQ